MIAGKTPAETVPVMGYRLARSNCSPVIFTRPVG